MKKFFYTYVFFLICSLSQAQVGINTELPKGVLHIDGKGNTSGQTNVTDDILIDKNGNIGVGKLNPTARLDIVKDGTTPLLRIEDGNQGVNKILMSDDSGYVRWEELPSTAAVRYNISGSKQTLVNGTYYLLKSIPVSYNGYYQLVIRWWGRTQTVNGNGSTAAMIYAAISTNTANNWNVDKSSIQDQGEAYVSTVANGTYSFALPLSVKATKGTYIKVYIRVSVAGPWLLGAASPTNMFWNPSIVLYRI